MIIKQRKIILYKNKGETPLECLDRFKKENSKYKNEKMTYAGRLDPLAEGLLLVLMDEECKNKEKYLKLDKEYEVDILFGFATDTYDLLGKVTSYLCERGETNYDYFDTNSRLFHFVRNDMQIFVGKFSQKYPLYSSKNVKGILESRNNFGENYLDVAHPSGKEVEIKKIEFLGQKTISKKDLEKYIKESINLVKGDFRQEEILEKWKSLLMNFYFSKISFFPIISIRVNCTSGTYMRSLANSIGEKINIPALALNIKRTKIGNLKEL